MRDGLVYEFRTHLAPILAALGQRFRPTWAPPRGAPQVGMAKGSIGSALRRAEVLSLSWESGLVLSDVELERKLYRRRASRCHAHAPDRLLVDRPRASAPRRDGDAAAVQVAFGPRAVVGRARQADRIAGRRYAELDGDLVDQRDYRVSLLT